MNWKHYLGAAVVALLAVAIANRVSTLSSLINNGQDLSGGGSGG